MTARILILLMMAASALSAQTAAERLKAAQQELAVLMERATKIAPQPKPTRSAPVRANPDAAELVRTIAEFVALNEDLPLVRRAQLVLADVHEKSGNPVDALVLRDALAAETLDDGGASALLQSATARLAWGDPLGALKALNRLQAETSRTVPMPPTDIVSKAEVAAALFNKQLTIINNGLRGGSKGNAAGWVAARRFIATWPMAPQCEPLIDAILKKLRRADFASKQGYLRQIAVFFPNHKEWAAWTHQIIEADVTEGDYNTVIVLGLRLLSRSESLAPSVVDNVRSTLTEAIRLNAQIAARKLTIKPLTSANRYNSILSKMQTATSVEDILTLEEEFIADYPISSKVTPLRLAVATAAAEQFPEEALSRFKQVIATGDGAESRRAALEAIPLIAEEEGADAAEEFISQCVRRAQKPGDKAALLIAHSELLEKDDRPDEALQLLEAQAEALGGVVAKRLASAISRLKKNQ